MTHLAQRARLAGRVPLLLVAALCAGCRDTTSTDSLDEREFCPQTYEFGNYGCAVVVAGFDEPARPWPAIYRVDLSARPARDDSGVGPTGSLESPLNPSPLGPMSVRVTAWSQPRPLGTDTLSMWIVARMFDMSPPIVGGPPVRIFAADSALRLVRFVRVGERYPADTVRLTLRPPAP